MSHYKSKALRRLQIGPFSVRFETDIPEVERGIQEFYQDFNSPKSEFTDFHVSLEGSNGIRRWFRPKVDFSLDGVKPFKPLPRDQGAALFEWGLNWCITNHCHEYLVVHAAVVEKGGNCLILPAPPGAGKSTLCAALVCSGWRLLSDELTLIELGEGNSVVPLCRPVCLKNESISIIKNFSPNAVFGPLCKGTSKGDVSHMITPKASIKSIDERASAAWIIFPRYVANSERLLSSRSKALTFFEMARQSFNFHVLGNKGFSALENTVSRSLCFDFQYSDLTNAIELIDSLSRSKVTRELIYDEG